MPSNERAILPILATYPRIARSDPVHVREAPGAESEVLAVRAYAERIKELIAEGLGREAAATASIARERFPAHLEPWTALLDDARLAAGDFDWLLRDLPAATEEQRGALEERLIPWIVDPAALAIEARVVAELFEIVTSRNATPEELAPLGQIRRRSPLASWKLLIRAIDAFHRHEDDRVAANIAAIDPRSPAARAGDVLSELTTGRKKPGRTFTAERLVDRISGGRASIAAADKNYDRRRLRDEILALVKTFNKLSPYALEQARLALLPICGTYFEPEQIATMFRIGAGHDDAALPGHHHGIGQLSASAPAYRPRGSKATTSSASSSTSPLELRRLVHRLHRWHAHRPLLPPRRHPQHPAPRQPHRSLRHRCGSDLTPLMCLAAAAFHHRKAATAALTAGRWEEALHRATEANRLHRTEHGDALLMAVRLAQA
jgi:hypothetical protein